MSKKTITKKVSLQFLELSRVVSTKLIAWVRSQWQWLPLWARRTFQRIAFVMLRLFVGESVGIGFGEIRFRVRYESLSDFWNARFASRYEPEFLAEFTTILRDTKSPIVVYDIGAYHGFYSLVAASYGKASKKNVSVVAFEPDPANYRRLEQNIGLNGLGNVAARQVAVGGATGCGALDEGPPSVSLDELINVGSIAPPSLIKMDIGSPQL